MPKAHLLKPVVFFQEKEIFTAHSYTPVVILETDGVGVKIFFKGFTKWVHQSYVTQK